MFSILQAPPPVQGKPYDHHIKPHKPITLRQVMNGITLSMSPISTHCAVARQGPRALRAVKKQEFIAAALELKKLNLGRYGPDIPTGVFVKAPPDEVGIILQDNPDLGSVEDYTTRYNLPVPFCIGPRRVKEVLIASGLVREDQFKESHSLYNMM